MRKHRYKGLMKTISYNICGDGYDADERAREIFEKVQKLIDKAYKQGRADAIKEFIKKVLIELNNIAEDDEYYFDKDNANFVSIIMYEQLEMFKKQKNES